MKNLKYTGKTMYLAKPEPFQKREDAKTVIVHEVENTKTGKKYIVEDTNRYWCDSSRGQVLELRNLSGKKIKEIGTKEIEDIDIDEPEI